MRDFILSFAADLECGIRGVHIGLVRNFHETDTLADPEVAYERVTRWDSVRPPIDGASGSAKIATDKPPHGDPAVA